MAGKPCPRCGGADRFYPVLNPHNGGPPYWRCSQCTYIEGATAAQVAAATPINALTPDEIDAAHAGYAGAARVCANLLYTPAGAAALAYLYGRGFTDATINAAGLGWHPDDLRDSAAALELWRTDDHAAHYGMKTGGLTGCQGRPKTMLRNVITIPYTSDGTTSLIRTRALNNPKRKYSAPAGVAMYAGATPVLYGADLLSTENKIILTEGEFKALAATQAWRAGLLSLPAVAAPGGGYMPESYLDALAGKTVYLCYDSEARADSRHLSPGEKFTIASGEKLTGIHLPAQIARIAAQLEKQKRTLTDDQKDELTRRMVQLQSQLAAITARGTVVKVIRLPRDIDTAKMDLDTYLLSSGPAALQSLIDHARPLDAWYVQCPAKYDHGGIWQGTQVLSNYQAVIAEDVLQDDGAGHTTKHRFDLWSPQGIIGRADIAADVWADPKKGLVALRTALASGAADDEGIAAYRAIKLLSSRGDGPARRVEYTALGWQKISGQWHYLAPDGSINRAGIALQHRANIDPAMNGNHYALCGAGDAQAGAAAFRSLLAGDVCEQDEALLLASMAALALVHRFTGDAARPVFWAHGYTGNHKTSLVKVFLSLQGPAFTSVGSDGGAIPKWDSTAVGLELLSYTYRDVLYCVDDYKQATTRADVLAKVLHNYSEGASRTRGRADLTNQKAYPARGIMVVTAEDSIAGDAGQLARAILYKHPENSVNLAALSAAQRAGEQGDLAAFWRGFIQALAGMLDSLKESGVKAMYRTLRDQAPALLGHARTSSALAANRAAFQLLLHYMQSPSVALIAADEAAALIVAFDQASARLARSQRNVMTADRPGNVALDVLNDLLASEEVYLYDPLEDAMMTALDKSYALKYSRSKKIGEWRNINGVPERAAFIYPDVAFALIQAKRAAQRQPINYTRAEVERQWVADGVIIRWTPGRATLQVVGGGRGWVIGADSVYNQNNQTDDLVGYSEDELLARASELKNKNNQNNQNNQENTEQSIDENNLAPAGDLDQDIAPAENTGYSGYSGYSEKAAHSNGMKPITKPVIASAPAGDSGYSPATLHTPPARPARRPQIDPMVETQKTLDIARTWIAQGRYSDAELKAYTIQMPEVKAALLAEIQQAQAGA